eukprot:scaffold24958_cov279-Cylindrotheca_fusiformis.AAC.1
MAEGPAGEFNNLLALIIAPTISLVATIVMAARAPIYGEHHVQVVHRRANDFSFPNQERWGDSEFSFH